MDQILKSVYIITLGALLAACGMPVPTATTEPDISPSCTIVNEDGKLYVLSDKEIHDLGALERELDQSLAINYPEWANYEQIVSWDTEAVKLGEIVVSASLNEELNLQINPAVTLVVLGVSLDWQLPANSDLFLKSREISQKLNHLAFDWTNPKNEDLQTRYPEVTNSATYAIYTFFDYDKEKLQTWCKTYQRLFGTSSLDR